MTKIITRNNFNKSLWTRLIGDAILAAMRTNDSEVPQFRDIREVRLVECHPNYQADKEVNEALELGWKLLTVQQGSEHPVFVLGWSSDSEPAKTIYQQRVAQYVRSIQQHVGV